VSSPAVSVRVPLFQTSAARVPNVVKERVALDQTLRGIVDANDVEAVSTVALVLVSIVDIAEATCVFVLPFTELATELEAVVIAAARDDDALLVFALTAVVPAVIADAIEEEALLVLAFMFVANEVDAASTVAFVLAFTLVPFAVIAEAIDDDALFVFALMFEASDVDAARTVLLVFVFTAEVPAVIALAMDVDAVVTSDCRASVPEVSVPAVRVRAPKLQTWEAVRPELTLFAS